MCQDGSCILHLSFSGDTIKSLILGNKSQTLTGDAYIMVCASPPSCDSSILGICGKPTHLLPTHCGLSWCRRGRKLLSKGQDLHSWSWLNSAQQLSSQSQRHLVDLLVWHYPPITVLRFGVSVSIVSKLVWLHIISIGSPT